MAKKTKSTNPAKPSKKDGTDATSAADTSASAVFAPDAESKQPKAASGAPNLPTPDANRARGNPHKNPSPFNADGRLDRAAMERVIDNKGSVIFKGEVISSKGNLPNDEQIDQHHNARLQDEDTLIDEQIARLNVRKAALIKARK